MKIYSSKTSEKYKRIYDDEQLVAKVVFGSTRADMKLKSWTS